MTFLVVSCIGPDSETDISSYQDLKKHFKPEFLRHFPKTLENPESASVYYSPSFLQGGTTFQLIYKYKNSNEAQGEYKRLEKKSSQKGSFNRINDSLNIAIGFEVMVGNKNEIDNDSKILIFQSNPLANTKSIWNHGFTTGIAFNETENSILYWIEEW